MRRLSFAFLLLIAGVSVAIVQPLQDPWHRPLSPQGQSAGITYGTTAPSLASTGMNPGQGEVWIDTDGATDAGPLMFVYDHVNGSWDAVLNSAALTANVIPVFNGLELIDSTVTDDATDVVATGGLITAGTAVNAANSIMLDGNNNELIFEGGTLSAAEIIFAAVDPNTDLTLTFDNPAASTDGTWVEISGTLAQQDAGNTWLGLHINLDSPADHLGAATMRGIELENDTNTATGEETALHFTTGWDAEIHFADPTATLWWLETGRFTLQDYGGDFQFILEDVQDLTGSDSAEALATITASLGVIDGGDTQQILFLNPTGDLASTGGTIIGLGVGLTNPDVNVNEFATRFDADWDIEFVFLGAEVISSYASAGSYVIRDGGTDNVFTLRDVPAISASADLMELDATTVQIDVGDTIRGLFIDLTTSAATTGGTFNAFEIDGITARAAAERAILIGAGYDTDIQFSDPGVRLQYANTGSLEIRDGGGANTFTLRDVPAAGTANNLAELAVTLSAMDGAGDTFRAFLLNIARADHTNGTLVGIDVDLDVDDAQSDDVALRVTGTWDYTLQQAGTAFASLPAAVAGAMIYCTDCDLASVPCASTPGPGAWAFGTNTPRWECPW